MGHSKHSNFDFDLIESIKENNSYGFVLKKSVKTNNYPKNVATVFNKQYKSVKSPVGQIVLSILNACVNQKRIFFIMTRKTAKKLAQTDPNWVSPPKLANDKWKQVLSIAYHGGFFKQIYKGEGQQPSVYEITHPKFIELIQVDMGLQRKECLDFITKSSIITNKTKTNQVSSMIELAQSPIQVSPPINEDLLREENKKFKHTDFGLDFLETLNKTIQNQPYHYLKNHSNKYGFASLPDKSKLIHMIEDKFYNDKFLNLKNKALSQVNKAYKECFLDVPRDQVSEKKIEIYLAGVEEMQTVPLNDLNPKEKLIFESKKQEVIKASILKNNGGVMPDDLKVIREEARKLAEAKQIINNVESSLMNAEADDIFNKMFARAENGVIGTDRDDS